MIFLFHCHGCLLERAMSEISDKGLPQKKLQTFVMSAKLSLARQKSRESRKVQVKNGLRTGSTLLVRKIPVGCSGGPQVSGWKAREREQRTHQKRAVGARRENSKVKALAARISIANEAC